jgi:hypothetical protein
LSRLFSINYSFDHSRNAQECINRFNTIRGTYGGTYEYENNSPHTDVPLDPKSLILIWDTGALYGLTPFRSDFIDYVACTIPVRDVTRVNTVIGIVLKFERGAILSRQPYIDFSRSTLDHFCDGSQDFLTLSRLFSINFSFDHSRCAQECINRFNTIRGTFGGTYEYENSSCHTDVPLDPKSIILIWDTGALYGLTPFRSDFIDYVGAQSL